MINSERQHTIKILSIGLAFGVSMFVGQETPAESTLINQNVPVTFNEAGVFTRDAVKVGAGPEITPFDGTNMGNGILFPNEFIDIGEARIVFQIEGLGDTQWSSKPLHPALPI